MVAEAKISHKAIVLKYAQPQLLHPGFVFEMNVALQ